MKYSVVIGGLVVMIVGSVLVDTLGFTESCATEMTAKITEYIPLVVGGAMAWWGRVRMGGVTLLGRKK